MKYFDKQHSKVDEPSKNHFGDETQKGILPLSSKPPPFQLFASSAEKEQEDLSPEKKKR